MTERHAGIVIVVFVVWLPLASADGPAAPQAGQPPAPSSITETLEKRLVQLDVGVSGDAEAIRGLKAEDFVLYVGNHEVSGLVVDHLCAPPTGSVPAVEGSQPKVAPELSRPKSTFIFFFDQPHLTQAGRDLSLETTRDLINRLVVEGSRASIVSSASSMQTIVPMTGDREKLLAGLVKLRADLKQWDSYAVTEGGRAAQIMNALTPHMACLIARNYALEEWQMAKRSTSRIGSALVALTEVPAPKALVYFGDTLRQKAGLHFLGIRQDAPCPERTSAELVPSAAFEFDALINEALARGVHFLTIQAEGFGLYGRGWDTERHRHAQDALVGLAAETGGEAFLGGASNKYIADRIETLSSCRLLLSFPPGDLPRDKPLGVTLELHVPKVKIQAQGRIVLPSAASIEQARLVAAFADPSSRDDGSLRAFLIPRGGNGKTWKAAVQLRLRPTGIPGNSAELGASIVRRDKVVDQFSASIATKVGSRPTVLEQSVDFAPGEFSVVAVARDAKRGDIGSTRLDANWPSAGKSTVAVAPIAVLQVGPAAMSKDGAAGSSGSLARDVDELLDPTANITLQTVVCRSGTIRSPIVVERLLEDGQKNEFAPMTLEGTGEACVQTVDVVRAGRLRPGVVDYRVVASIGDEIVAQERRALRVGGAGDPR